MAQLVAYDILYEAALRVEQTPPASPQDGGRFARVAGQVYPAVLAAALSHCDWGFASRVQTLVQIVDTNSHPSLSFTWQLPEDLVQFRELIGNNETHCPVKYQFAADRRLITDTEGPHQIRYTAQIDNEALMPPTFRRALALALASRLAGTFMPVASRIQLLEAERDDAFAEARRLEGRNVSERNWYLGDTAEGIMIDWAAEAQR